MDEDTKPRYKNTKKKCKKYRDFFKSDQEFDLFVRLPLKDDSQRFGYIRKLLAEKGVDIHESYKFESFDKFNSDVSSAVESAFVNEEPLMDF